MFPDVCVCTSSRVLASPRVWQASLCLCSCVHVRIRVTSLGAGLYVNTGASASCRKGSDAGPGEVAQWVCGPHQAPHCSQACDCVVSGRARGACQDPVCARRRAQGPLTQPPEQLHSQCSIDKKQEHEKKAQVAHLHEREAEPGQAGGQGGPSPCCRAFGASATRPHLPTLFQALPAQAKWKQVPRAGRGPPLLSPTPLSGLHGLTR